jgi:hypothetical protein
MLQNRYPMEAESEETPKRRDKKFDPKEDAEKTLYRNKDDCFVPSSWIEAALRGTAKEFKGKGRSSLKGTILSSVFVEPEEIPLGKKTYDEIDCRPAVIQRRRIVKSRPRFHEKSGLCVVDPQDFIDADLNATYLALPENLAS